MTDGSTKWTESPNLAELVKTALEPQRREEAEAAAALAAPVMEDDVSGGDFDNLVETPESRD